MSTEPTLSAEALERRQQILDAAVAVFAEHGFHATRIRDVARRAGVAYGLVYHYFGSKQALLEAAFDANWAVFADVVEAIAASSRSPAEAVRAVADYVFGAFETFPDVVTVVVLEFGRTKRLGATLEHPHVQRVTHTMLGVFQRARDEGALQPGADPGALVSLFLGALEAAIAAVVVDPTPARAAQRRARLHQTLVVLFRDGLFRPEP